MKNLIIRALSGLLLVGLIGFSIWFGSVSNFILFFFVLLVGLKEFYTMAFSGSWSLSLTYNLLVAALIYSLSFLVAVGLLPQSFLWLIIPLLLSIPILELYAKRSQPILNIALSYYGLLYLVLPVSLIPFLLISSTGEASQILGISEKFPSIPAMYYSPNLLLGIFVMQWLSDTGAYLFGMTLGKRKLFPRISPNKSWEGAMGGFLSTLGAAYLCYYFFADLALVHWMAIGVIIAIFGIYGDLIESLFKRSVNMKDSGNILPGHGGILDRFDSALVSIPLVFCYVEIIQSFSVV